MTCSTCKHWQGNRDDDKASGECRRYPPQPGGIVSMQTLAGRPQPAIMWGNPSTNAGFVCGEYARDDWVS